MLNFIIGRKNSGKTVEAHRILGQCVERGEKPVLIVPKQNTFESDRGILSLLGPEKASEVEVFSFTRLSHIVLERYGGITKPIAKKSARLIYMSLAIESLSDRLRVYSRHREDISLVTKMLSFVDEMKNEGLEPEELEKSADSLQDQRLAEKLRECAMIYRAYEAYVAHSSFDDADLLSKIYDILSDERFFEGRTVVIDGFAHFSYDELRLISLMLTQAREVYITLTIDSLDPFRQTGPFAYTALTLAQLLRTAGRRGIETGEVITCGYDESFYPDDLKHLEKNLYSLTFEPYGRESENLTVITAPDSQAECDAVARRIKAFIRKGEYRCRDIAVVYKDSECYERQLLSSFKKYEIPFFEDKRQDILNQPLINYVRGVFEILAGGFDTDSLMKVVKTGLAGLDEKEISLIENYAFMWDLSGRAWLTPWAYNPSGFGEKMGERQLEQLRELNTLRERAVNSLALLRENTADTSSVETLRLVYEHLRESGIDKRLLSYALSLEKEGFVELAAEQQQVWDILMEVLDELATSLEGTSVSRKRLCELFELVVREKTLGKLPDGFDEVSLCSAERMLTNRARVVFVAGLIRGSFPEAVSQTGLFSAAERSKILLTGISTGEDVKEKSLRERFLLYNALASAREKLFLSYCVGSLTGEQKEKSEGITLAEKILPEHKRVTVGCEPLSELIESERSAFELMAEKYRENSRESESLFTFFAGKKEYKSILEAMDRAVFKEAFAFEDKEKAVRLFGENMYLSASRTEVYAKCPFMYFCRYGVKANPRIKARLDPANIGTVIHEVLEKLLKKYPSKSFLELSDAQLREEIAQLLEEYMSENMVGAEEKDARFRYLYSRMFKVVSAIVERLCAEFDDSDFTPSDFELEISRESVVSPYKLELERGSVQLHGVIDRVDTMDLEGSRYVRIVDYKTGGKKFELSDVLEGLNMQMVLYLISIWRTGRERYENIIPAGVLYFPAKLSAVTFDERDIDESIRKEKRFAAHKMNGMIVGDETTARYMEKSEKGLYIPVTVDKRTGKIKGKFIDLEMMQRLAEKTDSIIREMGESLHSGRVEARVVYGSDYTQVCDYCDYREVCLEENPEKRYIQKLPHEECFRLLGEKEDQQ